MKRRNFLGLLGLGAVAPFAVAKGLVEPVKTTTEVSPSHWLYESTPTLDNREFYQLWYNRPWGEPEATVKWEPKFTYDDIRSDKFDNLRKQYLDEVAKRFAEKIDQEILNRVAESIL